MASMNVVILIGRVVAEPELKYTPGGKAVASFALAVDRGHGKDKECDFIGVTAWERLAEICKEFLTKGKLISIQGALRTRTYETQEGQKRKAFEVVASQMQMLSGDGQRESKPQAGWGSGGDDLSVDEIPF